MHHKKNNLTHVIIVGIVLLVSLSAVLLLKNRLGITLFSSAPTHNDLVFINDSSNTISVEYKKDGKNISTPLKPNEQIQDGKGFIKVFVADKGGSYDLNYSYPRAVGSTQQVRLSQMIKAANAQEEKLTNPSADETILTETGMVGDVKVNYEEVLPID